jgi:hypothetical protein
VVIAAPESCPCCGSHKLTKLGETIRPSPRRWRRSVAVEGDPDGAGEILLSRLREHYAAAGAVPCHAARLPPNQATTPAASGDRPAHSPRYSPDAYPRTEIGRFVQEALWYTGTGRIRYQGLRTIT